jgi:RNA polymerase sigma-70 factor (ECF subfamily)
MGEPALTLATWMQRYTNDLYRLALTILRDPADADDAVQSAFIAAARALPTFEGRAEPRTWLYRITVNACISLLRKRRARQALDRALAAPLALLSGRERPVESQAEQHSQDRQLWEAVAALDEAHRLPVLLFYAHDLTAAQIAEVLEIPPGTVHSRLHKARRLLLARLNPPAERSAQPEGEA